MRKKNEYIFFIIEIGLYISSIMVIKMNSVFSYLYVYLLPFIFFYEWLYFYDIEFNFAQIAKLCCLILVNETNALNLNYEFTLFLWAYSVNKNVFYLGQKYSCAVSSEQKKNEIKIILYYLVNAFVLILLLFSFREKIIDALILIGFSFFNLFVFYCKSITYVPYFDILHVKNNYFIPESKTRYLLIEHMASSIEISELTWTLPIVLAFLFLKCDFISLIAFIVIGLPYVIVTIKNNISVYRNDILKLYYPLFLQLIITSFFLRVFHIRFFMDAERISRMSNIIVTLVSADLIFNFTAMFILLQENFNKFHSVLLLKKIVTKFTIIVSVVIPAVFLIVIILDLIPNQYFTFYSCFCVLYCIFFSVCLLYQLKKNLNTTDVILLLISDINSNDVRIYRDNHFAADNNNIDAILKITTDCIKNRNYTELSSVFKLVLNWLEKHKADISIKNFSPYFESQNHFYFFIDILVKTIADEKSKIIIKQYVNEIYSIFRFAAVKKDFKDYHIFYNSLNKLLSYLAEYDDSELEDCKETLFSVYTYNMKNIFMQLTSSKIKASLSVEKSKEYKEFLNYLYEPIEKTLFKVVDKDIEFLKFVDWFSIFFRLYNKISELNINYLEILHKLTNFYFLILNKCSFEKSLVRSVLSKYKTLNYILSNCIMNDKMLELFNNVVFNSIKEIYFKLLKNKYNFEEYDFEVLYEYFFDNKKSKIQICYLNLFCFAIISYFDYGFDNIEKNIRNTIWNRLVQLNDIFFERNQFDLIKGLNSNMKKIIEKYPNVNVDYQKYEDSIQKEIKNIQDYEMEFS